MTASGPVRVTSLFEAHLPVADVARSVRFYRDVVGLEPAYDDAERGVAFLWLGEPGGAMLGLWTLGTAPMGMRLHVAFAAELDEVLRAPQALSGRGRHAALVLSRGGRRAERDRVDARRRRLLRRS